MPGRIDRFRRKVDYLRISVTDKCNMRCFYCLPKEGIAYQGRSQILSFEEILRAARIAIALGINKIRFTGGEPLIRKDMLYLLGSISAYSDLKDISLTTNGVLLKQYAAKLRGLGIKRVNISLDTLDKNKFYFITRTGYFDDVFYGIDAALDAGLSVKLNVLALKGVNDDEILDFVKFAQKKKIIVRFIEFMKITPLWRESLFLPIEKLKAVCYNEFGLKRCEYRSWGPAEYYRCNDVIVGFIKTDRSNCRVCSRLRMTAGGDLKSCLYQPEGISLRELLRNGAGDAYLRDTIKELMAVKEEVDYASWEESRLYMCSLGG